MAQPRNPPIEAILVDCGIATGKGVGSRKISLDAAKYWAAGYKASIANALHNGGSWKQDRDAVLLMAIKLGREAKRLAGTRAISKANARKASKNIANDPTCGAGGGRYCPPGGV